MIVSYLILMRVPEIASRWGDGISAGIQELIPSPGGGGSRGGQNAINNQGGGAKGGAGTGMVLKPLLRRLPVAPARERPPLRVPKCRVSQRVHGAKSGVEINF